MRIFHACHGILVTRKDDDATFYLNGVQSVGWNKGFDTINILDNGRSQPIDTLYTNQQYSSISIERAVANYTPEADKCVGPFLHKIFFNDNHHPTNYKLGYFPKKFGMCVTGNKNHDIKQFDLTMLYQTDTGLKLENNGARNLFRGIFNQCLISSFGYNIDRTNIRENIEFQYKSCKVDTNSSYAKEQVTLGEIYDGNNIRNLIRPRDFDKAYSLLPDILTGITDTNTFVDGSEVFGITEISSSIQLSYNNILDEGKWNGYNDTDNNMWTSLQLPLNVETTIKFTARKGVAMSLYNRPEFSGVGAVTAKKYPIRLAFTTRNYSNSSDDLFIIDLGSKNVINSLDVTGGDASGGNIEYSMSFRNFSNDFVTYFTPKLSPIFLTQTERY
jgi:hypothetical protein